MSGKVMVQETLPTHEIKWEVMERPGAEEESSIAIQTVSYTCTNVVSTTKHNKRKTALTILDRMYSSPPRKHIRGNNSDVDGHRDSTDPPSKKVSDHIDLLLTLITCPETDTTQAERPLDGCRLIRMSGSKTRIVLKHKNLELKPLFDECTLLDGFGLDMNRTVLEVDTLSIFHDIINKPEGRSFGRILVSVHFLLTECPLRKRFRMCPKSDLCRYMDKPKVPGQGLPCFAIMSVVEHHLEQGIVSSIFLVGRNSRELLIGRHKR